MKVINQSHQILTVPNGLLQNIESAGRTCYKSEDRIIEESAEKFVKMLINHGHHAMIEFGDITVKFITNRGVTHELVRHRLCSFAQESTRYVNYGKKEMQFIRPVWWKRNALSVAEELAQDYWTEAMKNAEAYYNNLLKLDWRPEQAREVLPNSLKTEIVVKGNVREWRHIFKLRCSKAAHPQIRALMMPCMRELKEKIPVVFDDIDG